MAETKETCPGCVGCTGEVDLYARLLDIINENKEKPGALIPVLQQAQSLFGYLPEKVIRSISDGLKEPYNRVFGVITFYSFFSRIPRGKYLVRVCMGTACYVLGANEILDALKKELKIDTGGVTGDRLFSLDVGRCFGACGLAPVIMINDDVHQRVKPGKIRELLAPYRKSEPKRNPA